MKQLTIDPMFRDALPKLTEKEFQQLEENILEAGEIREPLIVWKNTIIDGHNRYEIAQKHDIPFKVKQMEFSDQWDAIDWMCRNQLGKRNLTEEQKTYTLGKLYEARKQRHGAAQERDENGRYRSGQNDHNGDSRVRSAISKEQGVSPTAVRRAYEFSRGVDLGEEVAPGFRDAVISGETKATKYAVASMNRMTDDERKEAAESIMRGEYVAEKKPSGVKKAGNDEPYNADDFRLELAQFPKTLERNIRITLDIHGDMLQNEESKKDFFAMLNDVVAVTEKFKEELNNG